MFLCFSFKILYIQLSLGNRVPTFLVKSCQLCLPSVHFVAALFYLSVFSFGTGGLGVDLIVSLPVFSNLSCLSYKT